jgi:hypothetical protein
MMEEKQKIVRAGVVILIVIVLGLSAYYYFFSGRGKAAAGGTASALDEKESTGSPRVKEAVAAEPLTATLDRSDGAVRALAAEVSPNPVLARWLQSPDLLRRCAAAVDNIANGQSPRAQFDFFTPSGPFKTIVRNGKTYLDPSSFARFNAAADVFDTLSPEGVARVYAVCRGLLQQAYRELGYPAGDFHQTLYRAIVEILRTPVVEDPIPVEMNITTYLIKDPALEDLDAVQKHLLRMGPENLQLIQIKLREIALAIGFTEAQLPIPRPYR